MKRDKNKKIEANNKIEAHHHYHINSIGKAVFYLLLCVIMLVFFSSLLGSITHELSEDKDVYSKCVDTCSEKHFMGTKRGADGGTDSCTVQEFDRTPCIDSCNRMYLFIKNGKEK
jgi:hypothetical protein